MYFDLPAFIRFNFRAFFLTRGQHYRLTLKRFGILIFWLLLYIPAQIINRFFFLLDEILFPKYRQQVVEKPVFIIGNPRSGTTFLHRLMYLDQDHFTSFSVWELIFAPSISQRKLILGLLKFAKIIGYPIKRITNRINSKLSIDKLAHKVRLDDAEEDEHILIHAWSSETLWPMYPFKEELLPYFFFDRDIPEKQKYRIMKFYKNMLQRHIYAHGGKKRFLSKNPSHTAKLAALQRFFPDAKFINLARNPFEAMPSMLNYMSAGWKILCDPLEPYPYNDEFFEVMNFFYIYPVEYFQDKPEDCTFIKYRDLVSDPSSMVRDIYNWLQLEVTDTFSEIIQQEAEKARNFVSQHTYTIQEMGLTEERIFHEFDEVFSYYEFDVHHQELPDKVMLWQLKDWAQNWKFRRDQKREAKLHRKKLQKEERKRNKLHVA